MDEVLAAVKQEINKLPKEDIEKINECVQEIKTVVDKYGKHGGMAIAFWGAYLAAKK